MKKSLLTATLMLASLQSYAQSDTIFLDRNWKESSRPKAEYYRLISTNDTLYDVKDYYMTGVLQMSGSFSKLDPERKEGYFKYYYRNGFLSREGLYTSHQKEGTWKYYNSLGNLTSRDEFKNDKLHGNCEKYYHSGNLKRKETYQNGEFVSGNCYGTDGEEIAFFKYYEPASFPGGNTALNKHLSEHVLYPAKAYKKRIQGKVMVRFVIDKEGNVSSVKVISGVHKLLDKEAVSVVSKMPKWNPGKEDGIPVNCYFDLPINFAL